MEPDDRSSSIQIQFPIVLNLKIFSVHIQKQNNTNTIAILLLFKIFLYPIYK